MFCSNTLPFPAKTSRNRFFKLRSNVKFFKWWWCTSLILLWLSCQSKQENNTPREAIVKFLKFCMVIGQVFLNKPDPVSSYEDNDFVENTCCTMILSRYCTKTWVSGCFNLNEVNNRSISQLTDLVPQNFDEYKNKCRQVEETSHFCLPHSHLLQLCKTIWFLFVAGRHKSHLNSSFSHWTLWSITVDTLIDFSRGSF